MRMLEMATLMNRKDVMPPSTQSAGGGGAGAQWHSDTVARGHGGVCKKKKMIIIIIILCHCITNAPLARDGLGWQGRTGMHYTLWDVLYSTVM